MANYSAAFGYNVYIMPLLNSAVDTAFTGITAGVGTAAGSFINTGDLVPDNSVVSYANGAFTVDSSLYAMLGGDGVSRLLGLTNASLETDTKSENVITYDNENKGFDISVPTSKSWKVSLSGVADFKSSAYHIFRLTEQNTVADSLRVKFARLGPTGTDETIYGYGMLSGYSEKIEAGKIVSWSANLIGLGPYRAALDFN
jgi:hypothetical protein